jgi:hypothetical protein
MNCRLLETLRDGAARIKIPEGAPLCAASFQVAT